jgi:hydroxylamine reductase
MFCYQCEQTAKGEGCTKIGVCGKNEKTAALQDLLIHALKGLSVVALEGRKLGLNDPKVNAFTCEGVFSTLTNVNFDPERIAALVRKAVACREDLKARITAKGGSLGALPECAAFAPTVDLEAMTA